MKTFLITLDNITKALNSMPTRLATLAVAFSKERFVQQNWIDSSVEAWRPRSRKRRGGKRRQRGAVLVDSGRLKRSIRVISVSKNKIVIGTDVPYAQTHNDGVNTMVTVKSHSRKRNGKTCQVREYSRRMSMPQRRFLGDSQELSARLEKLIISEIINAINK